MLAGKESGVGTGRRHCSVCRINNSLLCRPAGGSRKREKSASQALWGWEVTRDGDPGDTRWARWEPRLIR